MLIRQRSGFIIIGEGNKWVAAKGHGTDHQVVSELVQPEDGRAV
jgi:hypothetical protein